MKRIAALAALLLVAGFGVAPASARDAYVQDDAHLFSAATVSALNTKIGDFNAQTKKEVFVYTTPSVSGDPKAAAEQIFAQQSVNGVLIYIAKSPKTVGVLPDRAAARYFPSGSAAAIRTAIVSGFNSGDFNGGITNGVDLTLNMYRSHLPALRTSYAPAAPAVTPARSDTGGGFNMSWIWGLIVLAVVFFIIRAIFRAMTGPRVMPPGYGPGPMGGGPGYGPGPGYGGYGGGYGPGYGGPMMGGGGGGFFSGLLGGLGGAWLGNELFGGRRDEIIQEPGQVAGFGDGGAGYTGDASGFASDPGQADLGNSSFGSWGDSGGGGWGGDGGGGFGGGDGGGGSDGGGGGW